MKIVLSTDTVSGTDRGGEDLFLVVRIRSQEKPSLVSQEAFDQAYQEAFKAAVSPSWEDWSKDNVEKPLCLGKDEETGEELVFSPKTSYGFQLRWTQEKLRAEVLDTVQNGDWNYNLRSGEYWVDERTFIDGNAD